VNQESAVTITTTSPRARTDRTADADAAATPSTTERGSRPLAVLTVAAPLLLGTAITLHPDDTGGVERTLTAIGGDDGVRWAAIHLLEPAAWALMGITLLLVLPRMAGQRGRGLLKTAGVFSAIGFPALAMLVYAHGEAFRFMAATDVDPSTYDALFEQFEVAMPLAALPSLLGRLGLLLATIGLLRARTVPRWAALPLFVPAVLLGSTGGLPLALGLPLLLGPMLLSLAVVARRVAVTGGPALGR
jgi:hypothetical protein